MERGEFTPKERDGIRRCTACGHEASGQARFCEQCGTALPSTGAAPLAPEGLAEKILTGRAAIEGERKQITVMFVDIVRSMELGASVDAERWRALLNRFLAIGSHAVHSVEGTVHQFTGDGVMALFGAPLAHEDHARRACLAALELRSALEPFTAEVAREDGIEFETRCGLNSGEVIVGSIGEDLQMDYTSVGNTNGLAKRMESLAPLGATALSQATAALVEGEFELRELGEYEVKGVHEPQRVFKLVGRGPARSRLEAAAAHGLSRFVGRRAERARLEEALEHALAGEGRTVGVRGEPGVGKSRLVHELARDCRDRGLLINTGRAVAHGRAVPLLPVLGMLRDFFGVGEGDGPETARGRIETALLELDPSFGPELPLVFDFLGVADPERPVERIDPEARQRRLLAFVGRLVEARSRREPAVIVIEDLHWIDDASAAFLEALASAVAGTRTLLAVTFRPEYEADWTDSPTYEELALAPLDEQASGELLEELLGRDPSLDGLAELIQSRTRGNPFFIEEVVQALAETGHLAGERGAYCLAGTLEELVLPPTVQAVLSARIDRLPPREKYLVQTMSVIGKEVPEPVLRAVSELAEPELADAVEALALAEFLTEERSNGHREYSFKHPLTQEVAYASQLSEPRARAHAAVAEAIERVYPDGLDERAALLAHHSEAAGEMLEAAQWHARAATWISVSSPADGMRHWRRVRELTDELESSPEVEQLAVLARISILALAWRLGMSHEETAAIHAEGQERLSPEAGTVEAEADRSLVEIQAPDREVSVERGAEQVLLDLAYGTNLFLGGGEVEGLEVLRAAWPRALETGEAGLVLTAGGLAAFAAWVVGLPRETLELTNHALAHAGEDVLAGSGLILENPYAHCLWVRALSGAYVGELDQAWRDVERSIELARERDDPECEGFAMVTRILLSSEIPGLEPALEDAERAIDRADRVGSMHLHGAAHAAMAIVRADRGEYSEAVGSAERALTIIRERRVNSWWEPDILGTIARARLGLGEGVEARAMAEEAIAISEERSLRRGASLAQVSLARVLIPTVGAEQTDAIERALSRALELARASGSLAHEPAIHTELAALARLQGDEATAEREEAEAERILAEINAPDEERAGGHGVERVLLDVTFGFGLFIGGREREGLERLREASSKAEEIGDAGLILNANHFAAIAAWGVGFLREAFELTDRAITRAGDEVLAGAGVVTGTPYGHSLWIRGWSANCLGNFDQAQRDFERSFEFAAEYGDPECEIFAGVLRAYAYSDLFEFESGLVDAQRAAQVATRTGNNQALAVVNLMLARLRGDCEDFEGAHQASEAALAIARDEHTALAWEPDTLGPLAIARLGIGRHEQARAAAEEGVAIARKRSLPRGEIVTQVALARVLIETEGTKASDAIEDALRRALHLAAKTEYRASEPRIHRELAALALLRGDEAEAEREEAEAERILAEIKAPDLLGRTDSAERVLLDIGYAANLFFGGREREGFDLFRGASSRAERIGDPALILSANGYASTAAWTMGAFQESFELADRAISAAGKDVTAGTGGVLPGIPYAACLRSRAHSAGCLGRLNRAWGDFERSIELATEHGDAVTEAGTLMSRASLRSDIGELRLGLVDAERAAELVELIGDNFARVAALTILARLRWLDGQFAAARDAADRALTVCREQGAGGIMEPDILCQLAVARLGLGEGEEARAAAEEANEIAEHRAERRSLRRAPLGARLALARVLIGTDGKESAETIERLLNGALDLAKELGYRVIEPRIHLELAALARLRGEEAVAEREEAEAERILTEIGAVDRHPA